jgi:hypothetical protein
MAETKAILPKENFHEEKSKAPSNIKQTANVNTHGKNTLTFSTRKRIQQVEI